MRPIWALAAVAILTAAGLIGSLVPWLTGVAVPLAAVAAFVGGVIWRVVTWGRSPVPFKITSVAGQQASLPWLGHSRLDSPANRWEAALRLALDVLLFRSLFRNTRVSRGRGRLPVHDSERWLWAAALAFHWSLLVVLVRHLRFVLEPVPAFVAGLERWDAFFQVTAPALFASDVLLVAGLGFLVARRLLDRQVRYVSLATDYFPLFLIAAIAASGLYMRYFGKVDLVAIKAFALGLATLRPPAAPALDAVFLLHLFLVSVLFAYVPFSKLVHMAGIFLSPTRTLPNDNRRRRHVNPWNPQVEVHTYQQWEDEFRDKLAAAGIPLERP